VNAEHINIRLALVSEYSVIRGLIINRLAGYFENYIPSYNPDLEQFEQTYGRSKIIVATLQNEVIGCGILIPKCVGTSQIVRMSVANEFKRRGVGRKILDRLLIEAKAQGDSAVVLETTASWRPVVEFYLACGFLATHVQNEDQWFQRKL
jgi:GNAT superfamily N-acetyltransferase